MSFGKRCYNFLSFGALCYLMYKGYRYVMGTVNLSKELPVYLKNVIGEKPELNINMLLNRMSISLSFSDELIKEHPEIKDTVMEYISRYYPVFRPDHITVEVITSHKQESEL